MAVRLSLSDVDLSCPICCEIFKEPVVLKCSHSFCAACLREYWRRGGNRECPLCRSRSTDDPVPSLTLRNLCQSCIEEGGAEEREADRDLAVPPGEMCPLHEERLKLFCTVDDEPICVVCHTSRRHKAHDCCPVAEAVETVKERMKLALSVLLQKKDTFDKTKRTYEETVTCIQAQAQFVERKTREEFEKLHAFLRAEEESRLQVLRAEEEQRRQAAEKKIQDISRDIQSLSETIAALEEDLALEGMPILHVCKKALARANCPREEPVIGPDALIDVARHLGSLGFHVWEKMQQIVKYTPVTLDPNTAAPWLILSDDLSSVHDVEEKQKLPDNPERYDPDAGVLARESFASGKHAWEVNVGDNTAWVLGVAKASVQRKEKVLSVQKNGYLCVYYYHKMYFAGTSPLTRLNLKRNPESVRVLLDCGKGRVSFYDAGDKSHIYTFKHPINERVYPYFWVGGRECPLAVVPQQVQVQALDYFS